MASLTMRMRTTSVYLVHSRMAEGSSSPEAETDTPVQLRLCDVKKLKETVENFQTVLGSIANSQESPGPSGLSASHLRPRERKQGALLVTL